ncbi:5'/3'-nucleotidase SurE [soil metagenome]
MSKKPLILVSNDDGIESLGIYTLAIELRKFADVVVAAPHTQQSAVGHSITVSDPLRAVEIFKNNKFFGFAIQGTPADSVKLAISTLLGKRKPDLCVSGINHGSNTAVNLLYSGTVSAASEAAIMGIPAMAVSLDSFTSMDFQPAARFAGKAAKMILKNGLPKGRVLNVNVPALIEKDIKGVLITRQGKSNWEEKYEPRLDPNKKTYYWLKGKHVLSDKTLDIDHKALTEGYISVTPIQYDLTDYKMLDELESWNFKK